MTFSFILASQSIGRQSLLRQIGLPFKTMPANIDENVADDMPVQDMVQLLAQKKALSIAHSTSMKNTYVIGADSLVTQGKDILGKPQNRQEAIAMLYKLQNTSHNIYSGVAVVTPTLEVLADYDVTAVTFNPLTPEFISLYVDTFSPYAFAGGYQLEGVSAIFIQKIVGCYSTVIGLPLPKLTTIFSRLGINLLAIIAENQKMLSKT